MNIPGSINALPLGNWSDSAVSLPSCLFTTLRLILLLILLVVVSLIKTLLTAITFRCSKESSWIDECLKGTSYRLEISTSLCCLEQYNSSIWQISCCMLQYGGGVKNGITHAQLIAFAKVFRQDICMYVHFELYVRIHPHNLDLITCKCMLYM